MNIKKNIPILTLLLVVGLLIYVFIDAKNKKNKNKIAEPNILDAGNAEPNQPSLPTVTNPVYSNSTVVNSNNQTPFDVTWLKIVQALLNVSVDGKNGKNTMAAANSAGVYDIGDKKQVFEKLMTLTPQQYKNEQFPLSLGLKGSRWVKVAQILTGQTVDGNCGPKTITAAKNKYGYESIHLNDLLKDIARTYNINVILKDYAGETIYGNEPKTFFDTLPQSNGGYKPFWLR